MVAMSVRFSFPSKCIEGASQSPTEGLQSQPSYLTESVSKVFLKKLIAQQIRQLIRSYC